MAANHLPLEIRTQDGFGDLGQSARRRRSGFIDMKVDIQPARSCDRKQAIEPSRQYRRIFRLRQAERDAPQTRARFAMMSTSAAFAGSSYKSVLTSADGLQLDAPRPAIAEFAKHAKADGRLCRDEAVDMRAYRSRSVGIGGFERKLETGSDVLLLPVGQRVGAHCCAGDVNGAVLVRGTRPDLALVEMRMKVSKGRPGLPAIGVEDGRLRFRTAGQNCRYLAVIDDEIERYLIMTLPITGELTRKEGSRHMQIL